MELWIRFSFHLIKLSNVFFVGGAVFFCFKGFWAVFVLVS